MSVKVGDEVKLPTTITANMSDGTTKEVSVVWVPKSIDTSKAGKYTATGTVEGYKGTVTLTIVVEELEMGVAYISLYKDSTSSSNQVDFDTITNFYLKNKKTGEIFKEGKNYNGIRKHVFEMKDIPEGEYTIHFEMPKEMSIKEIQLGETYKETIYNPDTNPLVIVDSKRQEKSYVKIVLKTEAILAEIKPLEDLTVPTDITLDEFEEALPKQTTIVDSTGKEHQVEIKWGIIPLAFEGWKKPGEVKIWSKLFNLPISVTNTDPPTRLEVTLNVIFEDILDPELEKVIAEAEKVINGLEDAIKKAKNSDEAQAEINKAQDKVNKVKELDSKYDTSKWDSVIAGNQKVVDQMKEQEEADQAAAKKVIKLIDDLPSSQQIKIEHKEIVEAVRKAYNDLTVGQQALVTNTNKLLDVEGALKKVEDAISNEKDALEAKKTLNITVKGDKLTLVTEGAKGTSIEWHSSDPKYVDASTGQVTRPWLFSKDIILTATITKGTATVKQLFTVKVPAFGDITIKKN